MYTTILSLVMALSLPFSTGSYGQQDHTDDIYTFMKVVKQHVIDHDWDELVNCCDYDHYRDQVGMGMSQSQYIAEILGIHNQGNSIAKKGPPRTRHLNRIVDIRMTTPVAAGADYKVSGVVYLWNGDKLQMSALVVKTDNGLKLSGARG